MPGRVVLLLGLLAGCASLPEPVPRPLAPEDAAAVARAAEAVERGRPEAAALVEAILVRDPLSVDGRRLRQNLRIRTGEDFEVYVEARAEAEAHPGDSAALYLLGRTVPDRAEQGRLFSEALRRDPSSFFAAYGLATALLGSGRPEAAGEMARRALRVRPGDVDARIILAAALSAAGRIGEAEREWDDLRRDAPRSARVAANAALFLAQRGRAEEAACVLLAALSRDPAGPVLLGALAEVLRDAPPGEGTALRIAGLPGAAARAVRARAALARGDGAAAWSEMPPGTRASFEERLTAAILAGEYGAAANVWKEGVAPLSGFGADEVAEARASVPAALLRTATGADRHALLDLARGLRATGFGDLAGTVCAAALVAGPDDAEVVALAADVAAWRAFLLRLRDALERGYPEAEQGRGRGDLDDVLAGLREESVRWLGCDVFEGAERLSVPGAGTILRTDRAPAFRERGTILFLGQRPGGPVEGRAMRLLLLERGREVDGVVYDLAVGDGRLLMSARERRGEAIAGFTVPGFVTLDLGVADRWAEEFDAVRAAAPRPLWRSDREEDRRSVWFPAGLPGELARASRTAGTGAALRAVLRHEEGHVVDADRFYPLLPNLPAVLLELVSRGFSVAAIEEGLEERAETFGLLRAEDCRLSLLLTLAFPGGASATGAPHPAAYRRLLERVVGELETSRGRYPAVDGGGNLLQQLSRLSEEDLRGLLERALR